MSGSAFAQSSKTAENRAALQGRETQVFTPDYFTNFAPRTARDMIRRIPGFDLVGAENKRGLGQGGANVLINGARIAGKTSAGDTLSRINATNVIRIEILDGAATDIPGLTGDVANVITKTTGLSGTFEWEPGFRQNIRPNWLNGSVNISGERGNLGYSLEFENNTNRRNFRGSEDHFLPDETFYETRDEASFDYFDAPTISLDLKWTPFSDHAGNLNLEYQKPNINNREESVNLAVTSPGVTENTTLLFGEDEWNASIGGDYAFPLGRGDLKLIGYGRFERSPSSIVFNTFQAGTQVSGSKFQRLTKEGERIGRAEYSWSPKTGHDWQIAAEGAFNFFDTATLLQTRQNDGSYGDDSTGATRVEEKRGEITVTYGRPFGDKLQVQTSLGAEYSELSQTGANAAAGTRDFFRPKGFVTATYSPDENQSIRLRAERKVGQLNFSDFVASVTLDDDLDTVSNPNLVPDQRWVSEVQYDKLFAGDSSFKLTVFGELISDLVDRIPVGDGDAVGNIENAHSYGIIAETTLKGAHWGFPGTELELFADFRRSSLTDPISGESRFFNRDRIYHLSADFRHDIQGTDWAYGFGSSYGRSAKTYRASSIAKGIANTPSLTAFIEHKDIYGLKVNVQANNILSAARLTQTNFFDDRRDLGMLERIERRDITGDINFEIEVSGTF